MVGWWPHLGEPRNGCSSVHHALPCLDHDAHARAIALGIPHRDAAIERGGHKAIFDSCLHAKLVGRPELVGQLHASDAAIHLGGNCQLTQLDDRAVDAVKRRSVLVERLLRLVKRDLAVKGLLENLGSAQVLVGYRLWTAVRDHRVAEEMHGGSQPSQHRIVFDEHLPTQEGEEGQ